ncbi:MAG: hypothetical protein HYS27_04045 [Deltaproteobacteria bacterium]|nr:hypothetical protein [Deltaproteobacteria bacterium]
MRASTFATLAIAAALAAESAGCSLGLGECVADDDCPLDAECTAGECAPVEAGEGEGDPAEGEGEPAEGEGEGEPAEGEGEGEGEGEPAEGEGEGEGEGEPPRCSLDDGRLDVNELPVALGMPLRYTAATDESANIPVDVAGTTATDGRRWDFNGAVPAGAPFEVVAWALADRWYADRFADAPAFADGRGAYVAALSDELEGVFLKNDDAVLLLGVASVEEDRTVVSYDPPITVLQFPLHVGTTFTTETNGSGTFDFNPFYWSSDTYSSEVDAEGVVETAAGPLPALRLRLEQEVIVGYLVVTQIKYSWIAPCVGVLAQVESDTGEDDPAFTLARHLRQLRAPGT